MILAAHPGSGNTSPGRPAEWGAPQQLNPKFRLQMNTVRAAGLLGWSLLLALPAYSDFTGKVVKIADGDTITVLHDGEQMKIRLSGIDAPEKAQPFGNAAKQNMTDMVFGKEVHVEDRKKDRYGRTIGRVWVAVDGCEEVDCPMTLDVSLALLTQGLAWHYKTYQKEQPAEERGQYAFAEEEARGKQVGLWNDADPVPPWEWRHR